MQLQGGIVEFDVGGRVLKTAASTLARHPQSRLWQIVLHKEAVQKSSALSQVGAVLEDLEAELQQFSSGNEVKVVDATSGEYLEIFIDHNYKRFQRLIDSLRDG